MCFWGVWSFHITGRSAVRCQELSVLDLRHQCPWSLQPRLKTLLPLLRLTATVCAHLDLQIAAEETQAVPDGGVRAFHESGDGVAMSRTAPAGEKEGGDNMEVSGECSGDESRGGADVEVSTGAVGDRGNARAGTAQEEHWSALVAITANAIYVYQGAAHM